MSHVETPKDHLETGFLEHCSMIWHTIQEAKRLKLNLDVVWLDLQDGIPIGWTVSLVLFMLTMEVIVCAAKCQEPGCSLGNGSGVTTSNRRSHPLEQAD